MFDNDLQLQLFLFMQLLRIIRILIYSENLV